MGSVQFGLNCEPDGILFGQTSKLRKLGDQIGSGIILDIERHREVLQNIRISKIIYPNIRLETTLVQTALTPDAPA
ncbi:hypothetical protein ACFQY9_17220 [Microvirga aerilata]|uniref:hypothetical protein n=1 Tax=Microvirga aerilata TaxID=670292 RepID=UPI0036421881